jgi:hypothetical protein
MASEVIAEPTATLEGDGSASAPDTTAASLDGAEAKGETPKAGTLLTKEASEPPVAPVTFELKMPEETPLDASVTEKVIGLAKAAGITDSTHAQAILDALHGEAVAILTDAVEAGKPGGVLWTRNVEGWEKSALADAEIGGTPDALMAHVAKAQQVVAKYGTPELKAMADELGIGSHPEFVRLLSRVHRALGEDRMVQGEPPAPKSKSRAERMFPNAASD